MALLRPRDHRVAFMHAAQMVVDYKAAFRVAHTNASTDSERYRVEKQFVNQLPRYYAEVDTILDAFLDSRR